MTSTSVDSEEQLFEEAQCGYLAVRPDGTILAVNNVFLSWMGYQRDELLAGTAFYQLLPVPARMYYDTHVAPLLQMQGYVRGVAFDFKCQNGTLLPVLLNCTLTRGALADDNSVRIIVFDATDRRQYERELLRAKRLLEEATRIESVRREEAERANRAKDEFWPWSSRQHTAHTHQFEITVHYRFHPRYGERLGVVRTTGFRDERVYVIEQHDGTLTLLPVWMADPAAEELRVVRNPRISREALIELRRIVDATVLSGARSARDGGNSERSKRTAAAKPAKRARQPVAPTRDPSQGVRASRGAVDRRGCHLFFRNDVCIYRFCNQLG